MITQGSKISKEIEVVLCIAILIRHVQLFGANCAYILLNVTMYLNQLL